MNKKKDAINEYKERKLYGGVYTITNTINGRYLIGHTANLKGMQNRFQFSVSSGSAIYSQLQKDWQAMGPEAFTFEVVEELEQKPEQNQAEFLEDLKVLEQLWRADHDGSKEYPH